MGAMAGFGAVAGLAAAGVAGKRASKGRTSMPLGSFVGSVQQGVPKSTRRHFFYCSDPLSAAGSQGAAQLALSLCRCMLWLS